MRDAPARTRTCAVSVPGWRSRASAIASAALRAPQAVGHQRPPRRRRPRLPWGRRNAAGVRGGVQQRTGDLDGGQPVGQRVVQLEHQPDPALGQSGHQPQLPQRVDAVQQPQAQLVAQRQQLLLVTEAGELDDADVVGKVEGRVVDPQRQPLRERGAQHDLAQPGDVVQAPPNFLADRVQPYAAVWVMQRPALGDGQDGDMLGQPGVSR
jgi:hypothetical protein